MRPSPGHGPAAGGREWPSRGGEMGERIRSTDWSATPLGPIENWSPSLRVAVSLILNSRLAMAIRWGPQLIQIYNDAYRPVLGKRHPWALGRPTAEVLPELTELLGPIHERVLSGETVYLQDQEYVLQTNGKHETRYGTVCYSPILVEDGSIGGVLVTGLDTSQRVQAERINHTRLQHAEEVELAHRRLQATFDVIAEGLAIFDSQGRVLDLNPAIAKLHGFDDPEEARAFLLEHFATLLEVRLPDGKLLNPENWPVARAMRGEAVLRQEVEVTRIDTKHRFYASYSAVPIRDATGQVLQVVLSAHDLTERKRAEEQLRDQQRRLAHLAHHDALTQLPNRLNLGSRLPKAIDHARQSGKLLALLYIDIDHFKSINDSQGHSNGDAFLRIAAKRLRHAVERQDLVARMSGDEFIVLAGNLTDRSAAEGLARRILATIGAPMRAGGITLSLTASIGVALYPDDGLDPDVLLKHADIALYQAKESGRNTYQFFADEMNARLLERMDMEQALRRAIGTEQIFLEYQPIVDLASGTTTALEALVRWQHPHLGVVAPGRFIPIAEECGAIVDLGRQVVELVCRQLDTWRRQGVPLVPVCINVSVKQLERSRLQNVVAEIAAEHGIDPTLLAFEITESAVMEQVELHLPTLRAMQALGTSISIDDFGTGYSSLSYLKHLPINTLKIDRSFVRDMTREANDVAIVSAIIGMAHTLGLRTVAEGVETGDQLELLHRIGCEFAQGFYIARPMLPEAESLIGRLRTSNAGSQTMQRRALRIPEWERGP